MTSADLNTSVLDSDYWAARYRQVCYQRPGTLNAWAIGDTFGDHTKIVNCTTFRLRNWWKNNSLFRPLGNHEFAPLPFRYRKCTVNYRCCYLYELQLLITHNFRNLMISAPRYSLSRKGNWRYFCTCRKSSRLRHSVKSVALGYNTSPISLAKLPTTYLTKFSRYSSAK